MPRPGRSWALLAPLLVLLAAPAAPERCQGPRGPEEIPHRRITWDDFRGEPPAEHLGPEAAHIATYLRLESLEIDTVRRRPGYVARPGRICLYALMNRQESGVRSERRGAEMLAHEQLHFDLTEAVVRHLDRRLAGLRGRGPSAAAAAEELDAAVEEAVAESVEALVELHERLDRETDHGAEAAAGRRWRRRLDSWLAHPRRLPVALTRPGGSPAGHAPGSPRGVS